MSKIVLTTLTLFSLSSPTLVHAAQTCAKGFWEPHGRILQQVRRYDSFLEDIAKESGGKAKALNAYLDANGLPVDLAQKEGQKVVVTNRLDGDDVGGSLTALFLKKMNVKVSTGLTLDTVYEVKSATDKTVLNTWRIPYNSTSPTGVAENTLFIARKLNTLCAPSKLSLDILLGIETNGAYKAIDMVHNQVLRPTILAKEKCPAIQAMGNSDYAVCGEFTDQKTKKKRVLIWEGPMT